MIGIYKIENTSNGKCYIGQSVQIESRWRHHKYHLAKGNHQNRYLQNAYNKSPEAFTFEVLEECDIEQLNDLEQFYIWLFNSTNDKCGYNLDTGGLSGRHLSIETKEKISAWLLDNAPMRGRKHTAETKEKIAKSKRNPSDETRRKMSESHMGKSGEVHPRSKKVVCLETGTVYANAREAARMTNAHPSAIYAVCDGKRMTAGGFHWARYKESGIKQNGEIQES